MRGSLDMPRFDLSRTPIDQTDVDLPRQINMIEGKEVTPTEMRSFCTEEAPAGDRSMLLHYANQSLVTPLATELNRRLTLPGYVHLMGGEGLVVNIYEEGGTPHVEGVFLASLTSIDDQKRLYDIEARITVDMSTQRAHLDWKLVPPTADEARERAFFVMHGPGGVPRACLKRRQT